MKNPRTLIRKEIPIIPKKSKKIPKNPQKSLKTRKILINPVNPPQNPQKFLDNLKFRTPFEGVIYPSDRMELGLHTTTSIIIY